MDESRYRGSSRLQRLLCRLGMHRWHGDTTAKEFARIGQTIDLWSRVAARATGRYV